MPHSPHSHQNGLCHFYLFIPNFMQRITKKQWVNRQKTVLEVDVRTGRAEFIWPSGTPKHPKKYGGEVKAFARLPLCFP